MFAQTKTKILMKLTEVLRANETRLLQTKNSEKKAIFFGVGGDLGLIFTQPFFIQPRFVVPEKSRKTREKLPYSDCRILIGE